VPAGPPPAIFSPRVASARQSPAAVAAGRHSSAGALRLQRGPVCVPARPDRVIGLVSRATLMKRYHRALSEG